MNDQRPDPDELLRRIREQEEREHRAKLKIFFGASAGVGKTYAMLVEAHERRRAGVDVVAGVVETHGRSETAALLEVPPVPLVTELLPSQPRVATTLASAAPTNIKLFVRIFGYLHRTGDSTIISSYVFTTTCSNEIR